MGRGPLRPALVEWPPFLEPNEQDDQPVSRVEQPEADYSGPLMPWTNYDEWVAAGDDRF